MARIRNDAHEMKIEHWKCQSLHPEKQLDYGNLLGSCIGGEGQPRDKQHCDTLKGDRPLKWNPADPAHQIEARIKYELNGTIGSDDPEFDLQINEVLRLNLEALMNARKSVLSALLEWWRKRKNELQGPIPPHEIQRQIQRRTVGAGNLEPFSQVAVWWLKKKL